MAQRANIPAPFRSKALFLVALLPLTACRQSNFPDYPANYREYAYVSNGGSNTVTVLDLVNLRQDRVIAVGTNPTRLAASPTRNQIYVANSGSKNISVINAETNQVAATIPVQKQPAFIDVNKNGTRGYVANAGSNTVSVLDLTTDRVLATAAAGEGPAEAHITPDDHTVVVSNRISNSVSVIDAHTLKLRAAFPGCPQATNIVILADGSKAFIACSGGHQIMVLGLAHTGGSSPEPDRLITMLDVGRTPVQLALKPDGGEIFVSDFDSDTISEITTGTTEVGGAYLVGAHPASGIVNTDNTLLWVANSNADTIAVYSIDDGKLINTVHVGGGPDTLAFSAEGHLLLAADSRSGDVSVVRTLSRTPTGTTVYGSLFTMLPAGRQPNAIVVKSFRTHG
jgi:YVTN family beta-propeller protein